MNHNKDIKRRIRFFFDGVFKDKTKTLIFVFICLSIVIVILSLLLLVNSNSKIGEIEVMVTQSVIPSQPPAYVKPEPTESSIASTEEPTPAPTEDLSNFSKNLLTGVMIDKEIAMRRPVAVVINNVKIAWPQSGIRQADILYEVLAEGDVTRIIAIFQDFDADKIGSIRSARPYFFRFAYDNDAIFVHHGASPDAYWYIRNGKIDDIDGQDYDGIVFWRDSERRKTKGLEHSSYTNAKNILAQIEKSKFRTEKKDSYVGMFDFYDEPTNPKNSIESNVANIPYIASNVVKFTYDKNDKLYYREQYGRKQVDIETGNQLAVTNVIIQFANMRVIDDVGRRSVDLIGKGEGFLLTNGSYVPISWEKTGDSEPTNWYFEDGQKLCLNVGKTWINVIRTGNEPSFDTISN